MSGALSRISGGPCRLWLMLAVVSIFLPGCGRHEAPPVSVSPPALTVDDRAGIITPAIRSEMEARAQKLRRLARANVAVLTVSQLDSLQPAGFADDAFASAPYFESLLGGPEPTGKEEVAAMRAEWSRRGILIGTSVKPPLVFVRVGSDFKNVLAPSDLHAMMENDVYTRIMKGNLPGATISAYRSVDEKIRITPDATREPSPVQSTVNRVCMTLQNLSFPKWRIYYLLALDPLLNTLLLTMKLSGFTMWGVLIWLFGLHIVTRHDWLKQLCSAINWTLLKRTGLLKGWLLLGQGDGGGQPKGELAIINHKTKQTVLTLHATSSHAPTVQARMGIIDRNVPIVSGIEAKLLKLGLGLPVWASLSLVTLPYWENILTMRSHVANWIQSDLPSHSLFVLQHGLLWWDRPSESAGLLFAIVFGVFHAMKTIPPIVFDASVACLSLREAQAVGVSEAYWAFVKVKQETPDLWYRGPVLGLFFVPAAVSFLPFLLALYFLCATVVEAFEEVGKSLLLSQRLKALALQGATP